MPTQFRGAMLALASIFLSAKPINARAQDAWSSDDDHKVHGLVGLGAASIPDAPGSDDQRTVLLPVLNLRFSGSAFYVGNPLGGSPLQVGAAWQVGGYWRFGAGFSTQANEPREADSHQRAAGVEDIERGSAALVFGQWNYEQVSATLIGTKALGDSEQGMAATFRLERVITPNPRLRITLGPSATWADGENMRTYFGVPQGSTELAQYAPSGGLQEIAMQAGVSYAVSPKWILGAGLRIARLQSEPRASPLVEDETQRSISAFMARRF